MRVINLMIFYLALLVGQGCSDSSSEKTTLLTRSGFPYAFHEKRVGLVPEAGDKVRFILSVYQNGIKVGNEDMTGVLPDTSIVDASRPFVDLIYLMSPMDSASVYVYGDKLSQLKMEGLQPTDTIEYAVRFVKVVRPRLEQEYYVKQEAQGMAYLKSILEGYKARTLGDSLIKKPSGLEYIVHKRGTGRFPMDQETVVAHYIGMLEDGTVFDNSFQRGEPFSFDLGSMQILVGWNEGLRLLREQGYATLIIPSHLGYGKNGVPPLIPPDARIFFYVELLEIRDKPTITIFENQPQ